jgi:hypothetical protein
MLHLHLRADLTFREPEISEGSSYFFFSVTGIQAQVRVPAPMPIWLTHLFSLRHPYQAMGGILGLEENENQRALFLLKSPDLCLISIEVCAACLGKRLILMQIPSLSPTCPCPKPDCPSGREGCLTLSPGLPPPAWGSHSHTTARCLHLLEIPKGPNLARS